MLKKVCMVILMLSIICSIALQGSSNIFGEEEKAIAANKVNSIDEVFKASGCEWIQVNVNGWAMLNYFNGTMDNMKKIGLDAVKFFELRSDYDIFTNENEFIRQTNISGVNADGDVVTVIISNEISSEREKETYVVVDIVSRNQERSSRDMVEKLERFFRTLNAKPQISTTFTGTFSKEYNEEQQERICIEIFESIGGNIIQSLKEDGFVSMAGYSPYLGDKLKAGNDYINLQVALRYSSYWGKTYIWIGTPIITTEY